jgi:hypothetical protein
MHGLTELAQMQRRSSKEPLLDLELLRAHYSHQPVRVQDAGLWGSTATETTSAAQGVAKIATVPRVCFNQYPNICHAAAAVGPLQLCGYCLYHLLEGNTMTRKDPIMFHTHDRLLCSTLLSFLYGFVPGPGHDVKYWATRINVH